MSDNLSILGYESPFNERELEATKEINRLTDLIQSVEIPTNPQKIKDYQAKVQAKNLYAEINADLNAAISIHNQIIADKQKHREDFLKEADTAFRSVNTTPTVDYGAKYGVIGLSQADYLMLLFDSNESQIKEHFEIFASQLDESLAGAELQVKRQFDHSREIVLNFMASYGIDKDHLLEFVATTLAAVEKEDQERQASITRTIQQGTPDLQRMSRSFTGGEEYTIDEDGFHDYGVATTQEGY